MIRNLDKLPLTLWVPLRKKALSLVADDCGTNPLNAKTRHNLHWFRLDGVFAQASESVMLAYLSLFVLALGASRGQIGLMSALASLSAAIFLLPGAVIGERKGRRKLIVLLSGGGAARVILLLLALMPLFFGGAAAVNLAIALVVIRSACVHLGVPAWTSLIADIVPLQCRGRYFSSRNILMGIAAMITTYLVGQLISRAGSPIGYQLALGTAFVIGAVSTFSFARVREPAVTAIRSVVGAGTSVSVLRQLRDHPDFLALCGVAAVFNLSLGIAAPFFSVYLVETLGASASMVGTLAVVSTLAALPGQRLFGVLVDRWGPRRVLLTTGLVVPLMPWAWALASSPLHLVPVDAIAGFVWAGYNLANFNLLLSLTPEDHRSRATALYSMIVTLSLAAGAMIGGVMATHWGLIAVFVLSGLGRLVAALFFARFVRQPGPAVKRPRYWQIRRRRFGTTQ
jgi:MFS family permease